MIAIVILGLGLLIVATMFPIAWSKARELAESTATTTCADTAETTVRLKTRVARLGDPVGVTGYVPSFRADDDGLLYTLQGVAAWIDPYVHALHMENYAVAEPPSASAFVGDFLSAPTVGTGTDPDPDTHPGPLPDVQVAIQDRLYPALPQVPAADLAFNAWMARLDERRFCWSVLHKLDYDPAGAASLLPHRSNVRTFTFYYVTLRRGQSTNRYARQDPAFAPAYGAPAAPTPVTPQDLGATEDVMFPVPWRVQIDLTAPPLTPTGLPSEATANSAANPTNRLVAEMLPRGAYMIDELNGEIYRVAKSEFDLDSEDPSGLLSRAFLTFESEVTAESLDSDGSLTLEPQELLRTVWVFPPPVDAERGAGNLPAFSGPQPVAGIEVRTMTFSP